MFRLPWSTSPPRGHRPTQICSSGCTTDRIGGGRPPKWNRKFAMASERDSRRTFFGLSALLFAASAVVTSVWCASMSAMGEMPMPGGRTGGGRLGRLTVLVGAGYFLVWTVLGAAAFPLGVALAAFEMQLPALARAVPLSIGVLVLTAGSLQFTAWKMHPLACCREAPGRRRTLPADAGTAWRHGLRLGLHCGHCCFGLTAILLSLGGMDL